MMRILVTGDTGTLGVPLMKELKQQYPNAEIWGISRRHTSNKNHIRCDVRNFRELENIIVCTIWPDYIYHLAAEFGRENGEKYYNDLWTTNVIGIENMCRVCQIHGIKLIFASSSEVYGEIDYGDNYIHESAFDNYPIHHLNSYAMTKWVGEHIIMNWEKRGLKAMRPRFFNAYGPGEHYHPYRSVICLFCYRALHGMPYTVYENYHRVFQYIDDFIPTLARLVDRFTPGEAVNIGGSEYLSVKEVSNIILEQVGISDRELGVKYLPKEKHNVQNKRPDITLACEKYGHKPDTPINTGITNTLYWMREVY